MELLQLKYFQSVAKHENMTKAAQELHISQPSLSITIKRLEDELSVPLFNRKGKKIELSIFGHHFLKHTNSIINEIENAKDELLELYGNSNMHLSLTTDTSLFLSGLLKNFLMQNETVKVKQSINNLQDIYEKLQDRSVDFAIVSNKIDSPHIESITLMEEEIVVVVPKNHPLAKKRSIYLKELKNENFIELTETHYFKHLTDKLFEKAGFVPNTTFEGDASIISELLDVKSSFALASISVCIKSNKADTYSILRLKDKDNKRKIYISYKKSKYFSKLSKEFLQFTIDYYKNSWYTVENCSNTYIKELFSDY